MYGTEKRTRPIGPRGNALAMAMVALLLVLQSSTARGNERTSASVAPRLVSSTRTKNKKDRTKLVNSKTVPGVVSNTWVRSKKARARLATLITKGTLADRPRVAAEVLRQLDRSARAGATDAKLAEALVDRLRVNGAYGQRAIRSETSVEYRAEQLMRLLPSTSGTFLDIGGADGAIAAAVGRRLGLGKSSTMSIEVAKYDSPSSSVSHLEYEKGRMPLASSSVDSATILMALHHMSDPRAVLEEARRVLSSTGTLVVRETIAKKRSDKAFNASADILWYSVFDSTTTGVPQKTRFRSNSDLRTLFRASGFEVRGYEDPEPNNLFAPRHYSLRKAKN
jgi:ubiquinone/menaquinone biosynthesis C-methylase UbiE